MTTDDQTLRKRLAFRSWHRGIREMDLILGRFADRQLSHLDRSQLDRYAALLENSDPEIYEWLLGLTPRPAAYGDDLWDLLVASMYEDRRT